jgi:transcription elongation factor Elf1
MAFFYFYFMLEHFFTCPYCWETISMLLDSSISNQTYIEDCEVCCNPIQVSTQFENSELMAFQVDSIEQ